MISDFKRETKFIIKLGMALHRYGASSFRIEAHLTNVTEKLGLQGSFLISPTSLTFIFSQKGCDDRYNHLERVKPVGINLSRLASADKLVDEVTEQQLSLDEGIVRLAAIEVQPELYSPFLTLLAFVTTGGAFSMVISRSWGDALTATVVSLLIYGLVVWAQRSKNISHMLEPMVAFCAAIVASLAGVLLVPELPWFSVNVPIVVLSSIIIFIPGLSIATSLVELSMGSLVSGTARLMGAIMTMLKLYFGAVFGMAVGVLLFGPVPTVNIEHIPPLWQWVLLPILSLGLTVIFQVRYRDIFWGILAGAIAFVATIWGGGILGPSLGPFFGAFALGLYSNAYARYFNSPASVVLLQGIVLLVPGSRAYIGLNTLVTHESMLANAMDMGQVLLIFTSLAAGLLFANLFISPRRSL